MEFYPFIKDYRVSVQVTLQEQTGGNWPHLKIKATNTHTHIHTVFGHCGGSRVVLGDKTKILHIFLIKTFLFIIFSHFFIVSHLFIYFIYL